MASLNEIWPRFMAMGEASTDGDDHYADQEITTQITIRLEDGREAPATLCLGFWKTLPPGEFGVQLQLERMTETDESGESGDSPFDFDLVDVEPQWGEGWTKDQLICAFNVDPDSPIWEVQIVDEEDDEDDEN